MSFGVFQVTVALRTPALAITLPGASGTAGPLEPELELVEEVAAPLEDAVVAPLDDEAVADVAPLDEEAVALAPLLDAEEALDPALLEDEEVELLDDEEAVVAPDDVEEEAVAELMVVPDEVVEAAELLLSAVLAVEVVLEEAEWPPELEEPLPPLEVPVLVPLLTEARPDEAAAELLLVEPAGHRQSPVLVSQARPVPHWESAVHEEVRLQVCASRSQ